MPDIRWRLVAAALAVLSLGAAGVLLARHDAAPAPVALVLLTPPPTRPAPTRQPPPRTLTVYVSGAVATPGVYTIRSGARVDDALAAAGGPLEDADLDRVNLAALLADGQQVAVPRRGEATPTPPRAGRTGTSGSGRVAPTPTPAGDWLLDVNSATADQWRGLPGIGKVTADHIVSYREQHGPYHSLDELLKAGLRKSELDRIRSRLILP